MDKVLELELRQSEARQELADLLESDADNEKIGALNVEMRSLDRQVAASKLLKPEPESREVKGSPEGREIRQLIDKSNVGEIFDAALGKRAVDGASAEIQKHYGLDVNQVPLAMLVKDWADDDKLETRAVTPAPGNVGQEQNSIVPYVFPRSAAAFSEWLCRPCRSVRQFIRFLTKELDVRTPAENADADETTGSFSADVLSPSRIQAGFLYSREDRARFAGMDAALRQNLIEGLDDGLDAEILNGTNGLFTGTNLSNNNQTTNDTFDSYLSNLCWNQIDGRYAAMASDLSMVVGAATLKDLGRPTGTPAWTGAPWTVSWS